MSDGYVRSTMVKDGLVEVEFFHPKHNSLPSRILRELADTILQAGQNSEAQVIILRSGGDRTFCAGASFDELIQIDDLDSGKDFFLGFAHVINACRNCGKIVIGRVQGKAVGGGVGLAAATDYCLASKFASIKLSEIGIGIGPFVIGPAVQRKIGVAAFGQLTINATEFQSADWAKERGLYAEVFESAEALDAGVAKLADFLITTNPQALYEVKKCYGKGVTIGINFCPKERKLLANLYFPNSPRQPSVNMHSRTLLKSPLVVSRVTH